MKQPRGSAVNRDVDKEMKTLFARPTTKRPDTAGVDAVFHQVQVNPPKQARSIETLTRLLNAAEQLLDEEGLDAATVPAIAKRAGVSVGVVYRRFADKDALLRAVSQRFLARQRDQTVSVLDACAAMHMRLPDLFRAMIRGTIEGHRRRRGLLHALHLFSQMHPDPEFKRAAHELNRANTAAITTLMLRHRELIDHPHPEAAIEFAILALASVIQNVIIESEVTHGLRVPSSLEDEMTRMLFGYLGIDES